MGEAFGLYTHIRNNRWRSGFLIASLFVLVALVIFAVTLIFEAVSHPAPLRVIMQSAMSRMPLFLPLGFGLTALWVMIGFGANTALVAWVTGATGVTREAAPRLYKLIEPLCISRGMSIPKLMIIETEALNAFASGVNESQFTVTVTSGLLNELNDAELEAVLAHELTHIRNGDVKLMIVAVLIAGVVGFFGEMIVRGGARIADLPGGGGGSSRSSSSSSSSDSDNKGGGAIIAVLIGIAILIVAWFFSILIRFSLSRSREYLADAGAVELTKSPDALISALLKISGRADIDGVPSGIMDMCIENDPDDLGDIFSTHPSITKRVQALQAYAGGVLPQPEKPRPPILSQREPLPQIVESRGPWGRHEAGKP